MSPELFVIQLGPQTHELGLADRRKLAQFVPNCVLGDGMNI
jgi:hypothetical protein